MVRVLELFSGTGSIQKVCVERGWDVVSLDRDLKADIKEDIMTWDYKKDYKPGDFDIITASPVCLWWSKLRNTWIGRKIKAHGDKIITKELLLEDIEKYGKPMVDKVREIIDYFKPKYWWIENPQTGKMKEYITDLDYYDVDYCKYSNWGYKKRTRFWTNIKGFEPKKCNKDCGMYEKNGHIKQLGKMTDKTTRYERYRIPFKLIRGLFDCCDL
jgi:hypothetical protein